MKFFCVESPFVEHCFIEEAGRIPGGVRAKVRLRPELGNSLGRAHGGLITTLLDAAMTVAARYALHPAGEVGAATVDLNATFIGEAKSELTCEARLTARRGSLLYLEASVRNEDGELVARGVGTFKSLAPGGRA